MSRLTGHDDKYVYIRGCRKRYTNVERKGANFANAIVRLAAYEDTGLTPSEVKAMMRWSHRLTVDELWEMDGEPVWWEDKYGRSGWGLVSVGVDCIMIHVVNDEPFCAVSNGVLNTPFVVGIYHRKPYKKEDA